MRPRRIAFGVGVLSLLTALAVAAPYQTYTGVASASNVNTTVTFSDNGSGGNGQPFAARSVEVYNAGPVAAFVDCKDGTATTADTRIEPGQSHLFMYYGATGGLSSCGVITASSTASVTFEASMPAGAVSIRTNGAGNLAQIAGTTIVNGGLAGSQAVGGTAANNAAITQNPLLIGVEARSSQPTAATTGNQRQLVGTLDGALFTRLGGPVMWSCGLDNIGATLTECQATPGAGLRLYVTDVSAISTTATPGQLLLRYGTGANCGSGTTSIFPSAATVVRIPYAGNTGVMSPIAFLTPLVVPANNALCAIGVGTNTLTIQINGYTAP